MWKWLSRNERSNKNRYCEWSLMFTFLKSMFCDHKGWAHVFLRNIYGDEINHRNGKRSMWSCTHCGGVIYKAYLEKE